MKKILLLGCILFCSHYIFGQCTVTFILKNIPDGNIKDNIYLAGEINNWNAADKNYQFYRVKKYYTLTLENIPSGKYDFKCTRGSWQKVECDKNGNDIPNREFILKKDTTIYLSIAGWKDHFALTPKLHTASKNVHIIDTAFLIPQLQRTRRIWIYLPPDYTSSNKKYPVIYMQDGQNLFDNATASFGEWKIDETLDSFARAHLPEVIIIGIDNGENERLNEYNPYNNKKYGRGEGNAYLNFLVQTLKPFIDNHYRTLRNKENTGIGGSSMGGLISFYALVKYPQIFGMALIFSPSFWIAPSLYDAVKNNIAWGDPYVYFAAGDQESRSMISDMQKMDSLIISKDESKNHIKLTVIPGGKHNEYYWSRRFPKACLWLLQRKK